MAGTKEPPARIIQSYAGMDNLMTACIASYFSKSEQERYETFMRHIAGQLRDETKIDIFVDIVSAYDLLETTRIEDLKKKLSEVLTVRNLMSHSTAVKFTDGIYFTKLSRRGKQERRTVAEVEDEVSRVEEFYDAIKEAIAMVWNKVRPPITNGWVGIVGTDQGRTKTEASTTARRAPTCHYVPVGTEPEDMHDQRRAAPIQPWT